MSQHCRYGSLRTKARKQARFFVFFAAVLFAGAAGVQAANLPKLSIDDIINMKKVLSVQISPDGRHIAYLTEGPAEGGRAGEQWSTTLWVINADGGEIHQLERGTMSSPQWSPDGSHIAFLASDVAGGQNQVFLTGPELGAPRQLTQHASSLISFQWSPDSTSIAFVAPSTDPLPPEVEKRIQLGFDAMVLEPYQTTQKRIPSRLSVVSVASGQESKIDTGPLHIMSAKWSPDGRSFLLTAADKPYVDFEQLHARLMTVAAQGGTPVTYCATVGKLSGADWWPDGRSIVFLGSVFGDTDFFPGGLFVCEGPGSQERNLTAGSNYSVESFRVKGNRIVATIAHNSERFLGAIDPHRAGYERLTPADWVVQFRSDYTADAQGGRIACLLARWNKPPDIWRLNSGSAQQLTHLNPELERREYGEGREVKWKARDGLDISGVLLLPVGYEAGRRYPLITHMHGSNMGEANDFQVSAVHWGQMLAAHGFAVLMTNFRGSITNGSEFMHGFEHDLGGADVDDAMRGADAMVQAGIADPQRLGISGVSYGGYLTARAITLTTKYRAAVMLSGVTNYYTVHTGWSAAPESAQELEWGRNPYDIHDLIWDRSPSAHLNRVKTPILILWGEFDPAIPSMQAIELFRGLRHFGVPSQLVIYPREGHVPREVNHERDLFERVIEWFQANLGA